ncbi:Thioredoxin M-type [Nymphaea thermarum]|nr:Thioredoxin M-type [Nymphaea thermarum]
MEVCLKASTITTTVCSSLPFPSSARDINGLHNLPTCCRGMKTATLSSSSCSLSSSSSTSAPARFAVPAVRTRRASRVLCQAQTPTDQVLAVTEQSWNDSVIESTTPVLVEFWAPWCGPCRMIAPVVDELAKEYAGRVACFKVNTDDWPSIATQYGIRSIPTVLLFKNGEKKETVIGAVPKSTLSTTIEKYL